MNHFKEKPFNLNDEDVNWVQHTLDGMTLEEKIHQLFCLIAYSSDGEYLKYLSQHLQVGGVMCRVMPTEEVKDTVSQLQRHSKIPMLIAANLESGANGISKDGTKLGTQMQVAATGEVDMAAKLGTVCAREGTALGANWSFAPIIDIDYNFRNPITNTRTFGSNPERVAEMGKAYVEAVQGYDMAACIKHFPGDGLDERDQHLVTSINDFSCEEWDVTYGNAYKTSIDAGCKTVMIGHIMHPAYTRRLNPGIADEHILPASLSYELTTQLLKEQLGFKGLVVTDASTMAGMVIPMHRAKAVPMAIAAGCDMFLFTKNLEEDIAYMRQGVEDGVISQERLNDAVSKILALKASLKLHIKQQEGTLIPQDQTIRELVGHPEHLEWAKACADKAITLVKEEQGILPMDSSKFKSILLHGIEASEGSIGYGVKSGAVDKIKGELENRGYQVELFLPKPGFEGMMGSYKEVVEKYDLIIYVANLATKSNQTIVRIEWAEPMGANVPFYVNVVPTIFISLENPYHLLDVPRVKTYINTYGSSDLIIGSLLDKLEGKSPFKGKSPVDPFCGKWDAQL